MAEILASDTLTQLFVRLTTLPSILS